MSFGSLEFTAPNKVEWEDKRALSKMISAQVDEFLSQGGKIQECENELDKRKPYARRVYIHKEGFA